jgi:hypothetical protein
MDTPSSRIVAAALTQTLVRDADGRELALRRMSALDRLRLFKAVGPQLAQNTPYLGMAMLAASVCAIDGVPVPPPVTEGQVEALVSRLGDAGIAAAASIFAEETVPVMGSAALGN